MRFSSVTHSKQRKANINLEILDADVQDSQCGTWELLIRAVYGAESLRQHRSAGLMRLKK